MSRAVAAPALAGPGLPAGRLGWPAAVLALVLAFASLALAGLDRDAIVAGPGQPLWLTVTGQVAGPLLAVVTISVLGAVAVGRGSAGRLGWSWSATALALALTLFAQEYAVRGLLVAPGALPGAVFMAWLQAWLFNLLPLGVVLSLLLFPDGRLPSRRWAALVALAVAVTALALLDSLAEPRPLATFVREQGAALPVTMPPSLWDLGGWFAAWSGDAVFWAQALMIPAAGLAVVARLRGASGDLRQQLKWVAYAGTIAASGWLLNYLSALPVPGFAGDATVQVLSAWGGLVWLFGITIATPIAAGIAVLRFRLYEIDRVINRTLLLGGLAAFITAVYVAVVVGLGSALGRGLGPVLSLAATAVVAVAFAPARERLHALANRLVYGRRATPYEVLADFAERAGGVYLSADVLPVMAQRLGEGTGSGRAEVWLRIGSELHLAASWPRAPGASVALPVTGERLPPIAGCDRALPVREAGELLGALTVGKAAGDRLTPAEDKLLSDLARQAGLILRNVRLIEELRSSRERIVTAQDDERRRLERNLHDGAQQQLVTASLVLGLARSKLRAGRAADAQAELDEAAEQLRLGLAELRDLARGLHPVLLTESGLAVALGSLAERSPVPATLDSTLERRYPAPVEATAYYVVSEALANVAKHAHATNVTVRAREEGERLLVEVADDGSGGADPASGSGLRGLEDRVAAIGGILHVESPAGRGTVLRAELGLRGLA